MLLDKLLSNLSVHVEPFALVTMSEGWRLHLPGPPGLLLHFVLEGNGVLYGPRGDAHSFAPRHLAVIPAGANHVLECSGEIHDDLYVDSVPAGEQICRVAAGSADRPQVVVGCGMVSVRYGPSLDLFDHLKDVFAVDLSSVPPALAAFEGILAEQSQPIPGTKAMTAALMTQCLIHLFRRLPSVGEDALPWLVALRDERLGRVVDKVLDSPGATYTVESLSDVAGMSRSAFTEQFTASFGRSPMNFVNHVRMQHAGQLLEVGNLSIDQIAMSVGYSSRGHFSRAFKDHSGRSPKTFRAERHGE